VAWRTILRRTYDDLRWLLVRGLTKTRTPYWCKDGTGRVTWKKKCQQCRLSCGSRVQCVGAGAQVRRRPDTYITNGAMVTQYQYLCGGCLQNTCTSFTPWNPVRSNLLVHSSSSSSQNIQYIRQLAVPVRQGQNAHIKHACGNFQPGTVNENIYHGDYSGCILYDLSKMSSVFHILSMYDYFFSQYYIFVIHYSFNC